MNKKVKILPLAISVILLLSSCTAKDETVEETILTPVRVSTISNGSIQNNLIYSGQAKPVETINVFSKLTSKVENTYAEIGDTVTKNDILFKLDEKDVQNQIRQLESQVNVANQGVAAAQQSLNNIEGGQYQSQILQLEAGIENTEKQLEAAEINLNNAKNSLELVETNYNNTKTLYDSGIVSKNDFDTVENQYNQAKASVEQAQITYDTTANSLNQQQSTYNITKNQTVNDNKDLAQQSINQASASRESAQVQLDIARQSLEDLNVTSPISGVVTFKGIQSDVYASPSQIAYTITNLDDILVEVKVSEQLINNIYIGQEVNVNFNALEDENIIGIIDEINPVADSTSTYPIKIKVNNLDNKIKPGMFAEVNFIIEESNDTVVLPRNAILSNENINYVYVVKDGIASKVDVNLGIDNGENVEILTGIQVGDQVVTTGQDYITDGESVNVVDDILAEETEQVSEVE